MPLNDLALAFQYRSNDHVLARDVYDRCLPESVRYRRAVGYFASSVFATCSEAFQRFFANDGRMLLICSPFLSRQDIAAIATGLRDSPNITREHAKKPVEETLRKLATNPTMLLAWLVSSGRLEVKIAVVESTGGNAIYHEKIGIFEDTKGSRVGFSGSANESQNGLRNNFEVIEIYRSWEPSESRRVERKQRDFMDLWDGDTPGVNIYSFAEAARLNLLRLRSATENDGDEVSENSPVVAVQNLDETLGIPSSITLRHHQAEALRAWFRSGSKGLFEMATGSGKTITALSCAAKLYEHIGGPLVIVVVCPYQHLVSQWVVEANRFGLDPVPCMLGRKRWQEELSTRLYSSATGQRLITSMVATNATFASEPFQAELRRIRVPTLFVADEVHNLGARGFRELLPRNAGYRIGLSATPERRYDTTGSQSVIDYFGPAVFRYSLKDALRDGVLSPYQYYPVIVELSEEESLVYGELTTKIARALAGGDGFDEPSSYLQELLIRRARLIGVATNKLPKLAELLHPFKGSTHNLIYCGDGKVESSPTEQLEKQIDAVTRIVGKDLGMVAAKYTAETPLTRRTLLRKQIASGDIQCLVAIRCLDEGIDIPEIRRAFILASSSNPRQFIQRRGRLLRKAPGKDFAEIFDFFVSPPAAEQDDGDGPGEASRGLLARELARALEFASLARNGPEALHLLLPLRKRYNLMDIGVNGD